MLHKEEAGLTTDRSLDGAPPEVQTFQIFVSGEWRTSFDKIKDAMVGAGKSEGDEGDEMRREEMIRCLI